MILSRGLDVLKSMSWLINTWCKCPCKKVPGVQKRYTAVAFPDTWHRHSFACLFHSYPHRQITEKVARIMLGTFLGAIRRGSCCAEFSTVPGVQKSDMGVAFPDTWHRNYLVPGTRNFSTNLPIIGMRGVTGKSYGAGCQTNRAADGGAA